MSAAGDSRKNASVVPCGDHHGCVSRGTFGGAAAPAMPADSDAATTTRRKTRTRPTVAERALRRREPGRFLAADAEAGEPASVRPHGVQLHPTERLEGVEGDPGPVR